MKSTVKTFQVLEHLCTHGPSTALTLSQRLRLNRSSVHRILAVLQQLEYVRHEPGGKYEPTLPPGQQGEGHAGGQHHHPPPHGGAFREGGSNRFAGDTDQRLCDHGPGPGVQPQRPPAEHHHRRSIPRLLHGLRESAAGKPVSQGFEGLLRPGPDCAVHPQFSEKPPGASPAPRKGAPGRSGARRTGVR